MFILPFVSLSLHHLVQVLISSETVEGKEKKQRKEKPEAQPCQVNEGPESANWSPIQFGGFSDLLLELRVCLDR